MTVLELRFPAGRYHATPWGRHVNEGAVEWPPSPWRIVRALIATWHLKAREADEIPLPIMRALVDALCEPPVFCLPPATSAHTRHYLPYNEGKNEKTTKVFDTFVQLPQRAALLVAWNSKLSPELTFALGTLADRLGYLGRAESLVEARVLEGVASIDANAVPLPDGASLPPKTELVRLLAPLTPHAYRAWRTDFLVTPPASSGEKKKAVKKSKSPEIPKDLFDALHADTGELQGAGWSLPPGSAVIDYIRPENAFAHTNRPRARRMVAQPTVARYAVTGAVVPGITRAVSLADRVHAALCDLSGRGKGSGTVFSGLDRDGQPRRDHAHAHIFCEANGPRDAITHITIWAPMAFDEDACLALRSLSKVWGHGGHDVRLVLHGIGQPRDFADCPVLAKSKVWHSLTPFISTRHAKSFRDGRPKIDSTGLQVGSNGHDLLRLLSLDKRGENATIESIDERSGPFRFGCHQLRSLQFQTVRPREGAGDRGGGGGGAFRIRFPEPVSGPLAFGYGAHFGLGLFVPVEHTD